MFCLSINSIIVELRAQLAWEALCAVMTRGLEILLHLISHIYTDTFLKDHENYDVAFVMQIGVIIKSSTSPGAEQ